ncbi:hypothetical protein LF95_13400 [Thalassospira sp. TSL5-1]|nr:hypothetical protein LF95_13400 [Thalassospira sp. TSL5-1]
MCLSIRDAKISSNENVISALISMFNKFENPLLACEIYKERIVELLFLLDYLNEDHVDRDVVNEVKSSCERLMHLFDAPNLNKVFNNISKSIIRDIDVARLRAVSSEMNRVFPIFVLKEDDVSKILADFEEFYSDYMRDGELNEFVKYSISNGLERLRFCLNYYEFFGSSSVIDSIYIIHKDLYISKGSSVYCSGDSRIKRLEELMTETIKKIISLDSGFDRVSSLYGKIIMLTQAYDAVMKCLPPPS